MPERSPLDVLESPGNKPDHQSAIYLLLIMTILVGVAGVFLIGPPKVAEAVRGLIGNPKKSPRAEVASPEPMPPQTPVRTKRRTRERLKTASVAATKKAIPSDSLPEPVQIAPQRLRTGRIVVGMSRADLLALWGAPDIKATTIVGGRFNESYSYEYRPQSPARLVTIEDGRVISTGETGP